MLGVNYWKTVFKTLCLVLVFLKHFKTFVLNFSKNQFCFVFPNFFSCVKHFCVLIASKLFKGHLNQAYE